MDDFDPEWIIAGLDEETLNLITNSDDLVIQNPSGELGRYFQRVNSGPVNVLEENSPLKGCIVAAQKILAEQGMSVSKETALQEPKTIGAFAGDDEVDISTSILFLALLLALYSMIGMEISRKDTSIGPVYGNYAEDMFLVPRTLYNTYETLSKTGSTEDMAVIDLPKFRLLVPVSPMRPDHSGTVDGKAQMMGGRVGWTPERSPFRMLNELASIHQDSLLGTHRSKKPAYMPQALGGLGKIIPFGNPDNWANFFCHWKNGERAEFTNHVIYLLDRFISSLEDENREPLDPLLSNLVRFNTQFHDWIKNRSVYAPQFWLERPDWCNDYIVDVMGVDPIIDSALGRAIKDGEFVTEESLLVHVEHAQQCEALLSQSTWTDYLSTKENIQKEWKSLSIYGQEYLGMIRELKPLYKNGSERFNRNAVMRVFEFVRKRGKDLKMILSKSPVYRREVIDALYDRSVMRCMTTLTPTKAYTDDTFLVERDVVSVRNLTQTRELVSWLLLPKGERGDPPVDLIEDDNIIVNKSAAGRITVIATDDSRLCKRVNNKTGMPVIRVPMTWYYKDYNFVMFEEDQLPWLVKVREIFPECEIDYFTDSGSISAFEEKNFENGIAYAKHLRCRIAPLQDAKKARPFYRVTKSMTLDESPDPQNYPKGYTFDVKNYLRQRNRPRFGREI